MRALLIVVLVVSALWAGYWYVGSQAMERGVTGWFAAQSGAPLQAEHQGIAVAGFPNRFDLTVTDPRLADARAGLGWQASFAQVFMMTWKPWHIIATLPNAQTLTLPGQEVAIASASFQASAVLVPGTDLTLDRAALAADTLALDSTAGWDIAAATLRLGLRRAPDRVNAQEAALELTTLSLPRGMTAGLAAAADLPEQIDLVRIDSILGLSAPLDRHAGQTRPALQDITLREGLIRWDDLIVSASGTLTPTADGRPEGRIDLRVENWRKLVPVLIAAGVISPQQSQTVTRALELLATQGGNPDILPLPVTFREGWMTLGPLPLGPAPQLFQRQ